jgi:uncharacterized 2Fe-2S/4Fe-4S cluster protein (DUF4445 family)
MNETHKNKIVIEVEPIGKRVILEKPQNGLQALLDGGIELKSVCAGKGTCGKCRILMLENSAPEPTEQELKMLGRDEIEHGVRLACQQVFDSNIAIYVPASSLTEHQKLQVTGAETDIKVDPVVKKYFVELKAPTLSDMESDFSRIKNALAKSFKTVINSIDYEVLKKMPAVLRQNSWKVTITVRDGEIINIEPGDKSASLYGIAIDLGTTKIATLLVDLNTGETIGKKGAMNPQISFGEDVMSRINFAMQDENNAAKITNVVVDQINKTINELAGECGITPDDITELTIVGNTAMHHLLLGLPVRQLGLSPFTALTDSPVEFKARDAGFIISSGAYLYLMPVIAGFVGSDHIAMILASEIADQAGNVLGIDIGTNTEIVLKTCNGMESVSTASGPAFEGAHIRYGMRAASGAIERVIIDPDTCVPKIQTIGDKKPAGICGSGILDAVAELLKAKIINTRGKFQPDSGCLCVDSKGGYQYLLEPSAHNNNHGQGDMCPCLDGKVSINQKDIVEIQLAKSAIRTGIEILLESAKISFKEINKIVVAGAFGSYIDPKNVVDIGMFPKVSLKKIIQVGNAAAVGAKMVLVSKALRKKSEDIAEKIKYLELTVFPSFSDHFAKSTLFPEPE